MFPRRSLFHLRMAWNLTGPRQPRAQWRPNSNPLAYTNISNHIHAHTSYIYKPTYVCACIRTRIFLHNRIINTNYLAKYNMYDTVSGYGHGHSKWAAGVTVNPAEHSIWSWPGVTAGFKKHYVVLSLYFTGLIAVKGYQYLYPKCCDLISHSSNRLYKHTT